MTDRGRRARWTAAATLSPVAAALFAGTTAWASAHSPVVAAAPSTEATSSQAADASAVEPVTAELQQTLDDETARVTALEKLVADLRAQTAAVKAGTGTPAKQAKAGTTTRRTGTTTQARTTTRTPSTTTRRTTTPTRTVTKAPAVHAKTGGS